MTHKPAMELNREGNTRGSAVVACVPEKGLAVAFGVLTEAFHVGLLHWRTSSPFCFPSCWRSARHA